MSPALLARSRLPAAALAVIALALSSCGGGGGGDGGSALLQASCAVDSAGRVPFLTVLARATPAGGTVAAPIAATVSAVTNAGGTITGTFAIGANGMGLGEVFGAGLARGIRATVTATVDGQAATATCLAGGGLPAISPDSSVGAGSITVTWPSVAGATAYRVTLLDGDTGLPAQVQQVAASPATFTTALDVANLPEIRVAALSVTADAALVGALPVPSASHESFLLTSGAGGGDWRVYGPQDFSGNSLTASFANLGPTEQVAVMLVNTDGDDNFVPQVTVTGIPTPPARVAEPRPASFLATATGAAPEPVVDRRQGIHEAHEALRRWDAARLGSLARSTPHALAPVAATAPAVPAAVNDKRTFCHAFFQLGTGGQEIVVRRRNATLRHISGQAQFWVTDEVWPAFQSTITDLPLFWSTVGGAYDTPIKNALGTYFGAESDIDGNGQMLFVFASLGSVGNAFPVGYFTPGDTLPRDNTAGCTGSGSNQADALYLTDPATFTSKGFAAAGIRDVEYPGTMAHELQHNVNFNERCVKTRLLPSCGQFNAEDDWINEGLSMVSEDAAGFGLATTLTDSEFIRVGNYLRVYRDYSLTQWESDPAGNYGGVHAFMRYWLDQQGPAFTKQVVSSGLYGRTGIEKVLGVPLETAMIRFTNALVFSHETFSPLPSWDYASGPGVPWSPLHQVLKWVDRSGPTNVIRSGAYVDYTPLPAAPSDFLPLRADGWGLYLTGKGTGGTATVTVTTIAPIKPHVVLARFPGTLPRQ